jgi:large subunit ribosomal protein L10
MKKLGILFKETSQNHIKDNLKESSAVLVIKYSGLSSSSLSALRQNLKSVDALLFVVKNSVAKRAFADLGLESLIRTIEGPSGLVFVKDEPVNASRALCDFLKEHEQLKLEGGLLKDKILDKKDIESMARLPPKDVLRAKAVAALNAPIFGLAMALKQVLAKLVYCLGQIKQKK